MKKILFPILFFVFFVQFSFLPFVVADYGQGGNLALAFILACCLVFGYDVLFPLALAGGLLLDYFSVYAFGTLLVPVFLCAILLHDLSEKIISDKKNYFLLFLVFVSVNFFYSLLVAIISKVYVMIGVQGALEAHLGANTAQFWLQTAMFALVAMFFFFVVDKIHKKLIRDRIEIGIK